MTRPDESNWRHPVALARHLVKDELPLLAILFVFAGGLLAFLNIADAVSEGETTAFDRVVLLALRNPGNSADPLGPPWLEEMARDFTALGSTGVLALLVLAVLGYLLVVRKRAAALLVFCAVAGGQLLSTILKIWFDRPRPDLVTNGPRVFTASFPSGHSMLAAVTFLTLGALLMRVESARPARLYILTVMVGLTLLVGVSRIYLGVHWPTDVLGGWCIGAAWAMLCWLIALWLQRRGKVEPPR